MTTGRFFGHWPSEREASALALGFPQCGCGGPLNLAAYGNPDAASLAAAYAYGLAMNHGFVDGNKRTAWVTARLFLADNGYGLDFDPIDAVHTMEGVAAGRVDEDELAAWFRARISRSAAAG